MNTDMTRTGIRILMELFFGEKKNEWMAEESMRLFFDSGIFSDSENVSRIIYEEQAEPLLEKIHQLLQMEMLEELADLKWGNSTDFD